MLVDREALAQKLGLDPTATPDEIGAELDGSAHAEMMAALYGLEPLEPLPETAPSSTDPDEPDLRTFETRGERPGPWRH
jgi:hypothetical protein